MILENGGGEHVGHGFLQHVVQRTCGVSADEQGAHLMRFHDRAQSHRQNVLASHRRLVDGLFLVVVVQEAVAGVEAIIDDEGGARLLTRLAGEAAAGRVASDGGLRVHFAAHETKTSNTLDLLFKGAALGLVVDGRSVQEEHVLRHSIHETEEVLVHTRCEAPHIILSNATELLQLEKDDIAEGDVPGLKRRHQIVIPTLHALRRGTYRGFMEGRGFGRTRENGLSSVGANSLIFLTI